MQGPHPHTDAAYHGTMSDSILDARSNLRSLRLRAMMTQEELAAKAGLGVRTVRDIELGRARPQPNTLRLLIEALDLDEQSRALLSETADRVMPVPRELPRDLAEFTGREQQLDDLLTAVGDGTSVVAVHGMAGVGKTSLAVHAAHALVPRYPDGQVFVDLLGFTGSGTDRPGPESVLVRVLRSCNVDIKDIPVEVGELAAVYRSTLAERRVLLVFDNAANAEEVERLLPGTPESLVIVTSRRDLSALPAAHSVPLEPPPMREAVMMIAAAAAGRTTADETEAIAERCGRLPLAMGLAAARLRSRTRWKAADLLQRLDDEDRLLDELDLGHRGVAAAFGASYRELDAPQRRLLRRLSLVPGDDVDAYAAAALCDTEPEAGVRDPGVACGRSPGRDPLTGPLPPARPGAALRRTPCPRRGERGRAGRGVPSPHGRLSAFHVSGGDPGPIAVPADAPRTSTGARPRAARLRWRGQRRVMVRG